MASTITLTPLRDVARSGSDFVAQSSEPWLVIEAPVLLKAAGHLVEIIYRASLWDEPVRPVFRFETAEGATVDRIAAGPVAGAGLWIGRVPAGTIRVSVSPTRRLGLFGFRVETVRRRYWLGLIAAGYWQNPRSTRSAVLTRLIGWKPESDNNLAWAIGSTRFTDYSRWRDGRSRSIDQAGIDRPRSSWNAVRVHLYIDARGSVDGLEDTLAALRTQVFAHWTASVIGANPRPASDDGRVVHHPALVLAHGVGDLIVGLRAGDILLPYALACAVEAAAREPAVPLFYGDEEKRDEQGRTRPLFKPGWSPLLQKRRPYLGRCLFLRGAFLADEPEGETFVRDAQLSASVHALLETSPPVALRRVLLRRSKNSPVAAPETQPGIARSKATAAVIIPTRDQAARLRRLLDSIHRCSAARQLAIVVVDNGSREPEAVRFLDDLSRSGGATVISAPGPFNFSAMCNEGARGAGAADVLVFLNDDTEVLKPDWLDRLTFWAQQPSIGAVGARLTYPDGRIQHIGVTLGMGGSAGHFGAFASPGEEGWAGRHQSVHEVSAVTGACLAVARDKFEAIGGFDAVNLPIELSDIDLCLKLGEQGWTALVDPAIHLCHEESVSRGRATFRRLAIYEEQRAYFLRRWGHVVRDDPYFHPGLSLYQWHAALS